MNTLYSCSSLGIEDTLHYFLHSHLFSQHRIDLMNSVKSVSDNSEFLPDNVKNEVLLFGDSRLDGNKTKRILEANLTYIKNS